MSIKEIKKIICNFVSQDNNDSLVIKGKYGVGKTYFWETLIKDSNSSQAKSKNLDLENDFAKIKKDSYAYVSLFGIDSLENLKNTIVAELVSTTSINNSKENIDKVVKGLFTKIEKIPNVEKYTGGFFNSIVFSGIRNALICFDDLDRKSSKLEFTEIIGLANLLKEHHDCKIVLILNEEKLKKEDELKGEHKVFREQIEKLVDYEVNFEPNAEEILKIIFPENDNQTEFIRARCRKLEIKNIRTLRKLKKYIEKISENFNGLENEVINDLFSSLCLFVYCHYNKEDSRTPTLKFIEDFGSVEFYSKKHNKDKGLSKDEEAWEDFLRRYGYGSTDEIDNILISFVGNGYIDTQLFNEKIQIKNEEIIKQNGVNKYHQAWDLYHQSFENNEIEFVEQLFLGFQLNMKHLGIRQLQETVTKLRQLDANQHANNLIDEFVDKRIDIDSKRALQRGHIDFEIGDSYLNERLDKKVKELDDNISIQTVLERFGLNGSYHFEDIEYLSKLTEDDFYNYFKSYKFIESQDQKYIPELYSQVKSCLQYSKAKDEPYKSIGLNCKNAIIRIALDHRINELRVNDWFNKEISATEIQEAKKIE